MCNIGKSARRVIRVIGHRHRDKIERMAAQLLKHGKLSAAEIVRQSSLTASIPYQKVELIRMNLEFALTQPHKCIGSDGCRNSPF